MLEAARAERPMQARSIMTWTRAAVAHLVVALAACSGSASSVGDPTASGRDGGVIDDASSQTTTSPPCPTALPAPESTCALLGLECEYGTDPRAACRDRAVCYAKLAEGEKTWNTIETSCMAQASCGDVAPSTGDACSAKQVCTFGAETCTCYDRNEGCGECGAPNFRWACAPVPSAPCPETRPNLGSACPAEGITCNYGSCEGGGFESFACASGGWIRGLAKCH
jgi:hypothetical protein